MKEGDRVKTKLEFLSDGFIKRVVPGIGFVIKLDEKAPNAYAYDTDEVLLFSSGIEVIK